MPLSSHRQARSTFLPRTRRENARPAPRFRPQFEVLEDRLAPAVHTWTGAVNNSWSDARNWNGGSPAGDPTPHLVFGSGATRQTSTNNLTLNVPVTISLHAGGYVLDGNAIPGITINQQAGSNTVRLASSGPLSFNVTGGQLNYTADYSGTLAPVNVSTGATLELSGTLSGSGGVRMGGGGVVVLSAANTYTGATVINSGTLRIGAASAIPSTSDVTVGGTLDLNGFNLTVGSIAGSGSITLGSGTLTTKGNFDGIISGSGGVTVPTGTLILSGASTYTGSTTVTGFGTLQLNSGGSLASSTVTLQGPQGRLALFANGTIGGLTGAGVVDLGSNTLTVGGNGASSSFSGALAGGGSLVKEGSGILTLAGTSTYTGRTDVNRGTLRAGAANPISTASPVKIASGATLDLHNFNIAVGSLSGTGNVTLGSGTLTLGDDNTDTTFDGIISGTGGVTKVGGGRQTFTGNNTYTGTTTIYRANFGDGLLAVNGQQPASPVVLQGGGILIGTGKVGNITTYVGSVSPGPTTPVFPTLYRPGILNSGSVHFTSPQFGQFFVRLDGTTPGTKHSQLNVSGTVTLNRPNLSVNLGYTPVAGDAYTIIRSSGAITGTFNNLPNDATFTKDGKTFRINYTSNTVVLTYLESIPQPGSFEFGSASYSVSEGGGSVTITVTRTGGSDGSVSVEYATSDATAQAGTDYQATSGTLTFAHRETTKTFVVPIINDSVVEGNETVNLRLSNPTGGATLGSPSTATLTITDNDSAPNPGQVQFASTAFSVSEGDLLATITVTRTLGSSGAVSVQYATSDGTATDGSDYLNASSVLTWADGDTAAKTFTITLREDTDIEGTETVNLALSNPSGGVRLGSQTAVLQIRDNDGSNPSPPGGDDGSTDHGLVRPDPIPLPPWVEDVTSVVQVVRRSFVRQGARYRLKLTLRNTSEFALEGPLSLVLDRLSRKLRLRNQTGITRMEAPKGSPYVDVTGLRGGMLRPGETVTVVLDFTGGYGQPLKYTLRVLAGVGPR